jgi:hypothetical protein
MDIDVFGYTQIYICLLTGFLAGAFITQIPSPTSLIGGGILACFMCLLATLVGAHQLASVYLHLDWGRSFVGVAGVLVFFGLVCGGFWLTSLRAERKVAKCKELARQRFPMASPIEILRVGRKIQSGSKVSSFSWDGHRVICGDGENALKVGGKGWVPVSSPENSYLKQEHEILEAHLRPFNAPISQDNHHVLCSRLYFNWNITEMNVIGGQLIVNMQRRDERRQDQFIIIRDHFAQNLG